MEDDEEPGDGTNDDTESRQFQCGTCEAREEHECECPPEPDEQPVEQPRVLEDRTWALMRGYDAEMDDRLRKSPLSRMR